MEILLMINYFLYTYDLLKTRAQIIVLNAQFT